MISYLKSFYDESVLELRELFGGLQLSLTLPLLGCINLLFPCVIFVAMGTVIRWCTNFKYNKSTKYVKLKKKTDESSDLEEVMDPRRLALIRESKRWLKQSVHDFQAAGNDLNVEQPAPEWVCFKCQQAAEKIIKSLLCLCSDELSTKGGHDLVRLASLLPDKDIRDQCDNLQGVTGMFSQMRYPDLLPYPKVPRDIYSVQKAQTAVNITGELINYIRTNYLDPG